MSPAVWTKVKERPEVTRDGNFRVAEYVDIPLALTRQFSAVSCGSQ